MKKCYPLTLLTLVATILLGKYSFAQQKQFSFLYHYASLSPNSGKLYCQITMHDDTLWHIVRDKQGAPTITKIPTQPSSADAIKKIVSKFVADTSILVVNKCVQNCDIHFMEITTLEKRVRLSMNSTFSVEGYKIAKIIDTYLPVDKKLNITKEYVSDAWDCELTQKSIGVAAGFEKTLFDSFCTRLLIENEYKKLAYPAEEKLMMLEDPVTGDTWMKANDSSDSALAVKFNSYTNEERSNILNGHKFPCLPLNDTVYIIDDNGIFTRPHTRTKNGTVFLTTKTANPNNNKCSIQLFGLRKHGSDIWMAFKIPGKKNAIYTATFIHDKNRLQFYRDNYEEDRFDYICSYDDPFR